MCVKLLKITSALILGVLLSLSPNEAEAGIVVTKDGLVFRGRIRHSETGGDSVTMRWPYKNFRGRQGGLTQGSVKFYKKKVRWWDPAEDELTEEYFKKYADEPIESRFKDVVELWRDRQRNRSSAIELKEIAPIIRVAPEHKLLPLPQKQRYFEINKPRAWATKNAQIFSGKRGKGLDKILMMVSPTPKNGYAARVHVVSVPRPKGDVTTTEQQNWYKQEIGKLVRSGRFEVRERGKLDDLGASKKDITMVTASRIDGRGNVVALRAIRFRQDRIYFVTCYAHEEEFSTLRKMFERCVETMVIYEDQRAGG